MAHRMRDEAARVAAAAETKRAAVRAHSAAGSGSSGGAEEPSPRETKLLKEVERYKVTDNSNSASLWKCANYLHPPVVIL